MVSIDPISAKLGLLRLGSTGLRAVWGNSEVTSANFGPTSTEDVQISQESTQAGARFGPSLRQRHLQIWTRVLDRCSAEVGPLGLKLNRVGPNLDKVSPELASACRGSAKFGQNNDRHGPTWTHLQHAPHEAERYHSGTEDEQRSVVKRQRPPVLSMNARFSHGT